MRSALLTLHTCNGAVVVQTIVNGSFETGDYTGWTLWTSDSNDMCSTGIGIDGQTLAPGGTMFDFVTGTTKNEFSFGLPITFEATDGTDDMGTFDPSAQYLALYVRDPGTDAISRRFTRRPTHRTHKPWRR